ncbi:MAG: NAD(P)/FAD-dependent oxidoreductase [Alphaproteobacteria bacterium]|nr:NAD(P)/FAD-dependent oxidoreductase [Alphaproteobacteria bacterium]
MTEHYDVAVIGAGHNGLVAANYLARAGCKVIVLEARYKVGGACVSEELIPGATFSSCAFVQGLFRDEIVRDLALKQHGLEMFAPDVQGFALFADGSHLFLWKELDRTLRELERYSKRDAERFIEFGARYRRFGEIVHPWLMQPPPRRSEVFRAFEEIGEEELLDEFVLASTNDLLDKYFESPHIKGFLTFYGMVSVYGGPSTPGLSYVYGHHAAGEFEGELSRWAFVKGGMGGITQSLARAAEARGVTIRTAAPVARVIVRNGLASGVMLESGEEIAAHAVISNADPKRSLLKLVEPQHLDRSFRRAVEAIDNRGGMARVHLLVDELPHYVGFADARPGPQHRGHQMLGASTENFEMAFAAQRKGEIPDDFMIEVITQSVTDPTLAPAGKHTLTVGVQHTPFELARGTWDSYREAWGDKVIAVLCRYAPNIKDHILGRAVITPLDLEREYNITGGNIFHTAMTLPQLYSSRPLPALGHYRTPLPGYYLCGAGTHPGGGVMGAPGHNAAHVVLADITGQAAAEDTNRSGPRVHKSFIDRMVQTDLGRRIGYKVARSKAMRPLTARVSRSRTKK